MACGSIPDKPLTIFTGSHEGENVLENRNSGTGSPGKDQSAFIEKVSGVGYQASGGQIQFVLSEFQLLLCEFQLLLFGFKLLPARFQ